MFVSSQYFFTTNMKLSQESKSLPKQVSLIPIPLLMELYSGDWKFPKTLMVFSFGSVDTRIERSIERWVKRLNLYNDVTVDWKRTTDENEANLCIHISSKPENDPSEKNAESYKLEISSEGVNLISPAILGALHGLETLFQLLQKDNNRLHLPCIQIHDKPRFSWRGLLIDSCRHWIPIEVIKRNIEAMASVKLNVFHWHLTNDQGFRVESKRFPKLHNLGSDGHFYSQEEIKDLVLFANDRGVQIVPEFSMPGHSTSWFVGYPNLASKPEKYLLEQGYGGKVPVMDPSLETTYEFIRAFLQEMAGLFPYKYVHIGGDQVNPSHWETQEHIQFFMQKENMEKPSDLQAYFILRVNQILQELGKKLIGWDPILDENLPPSAVIQTARGIQWMKEAVKRGNPVIESSSYYLDVMQPAGEMYQQDPLRGVEGLSLETESLVLGGEACMWTEFADAQNIESRIWPRAASVAERLWSSPDIRDVNEMYDRLDIYSDYLLSYGLTHQSGPKKMLKELVKERDMDAMLTFYKLVRPDFEVRWNNSNYRTQTPLNRLVDISSSDSNIIREFENKVILFINQPCDAELGDNVIWQMQDWLNLQLQLEKSILSSQRLSELTPLFETMVELIQIGISMVHHIQGKIKLSYSEYKNVQEVLDQASEPIAELHVSFVSALRQINERLIL